MRATLERRRGCSTAIRSILLALPILTSCALVGYPTGTPPEPADAPARPSRAPAAVPLGNPEPARPSSADPVAETYEVFGRTWEVMPSAEGYTASGVASWYGDEFAGRPTSSGEIFDPDELTAAHRSLPLHTWVEVTHVGNGRRVVVKINDRGPFVDTDRRIIDLSRKAAELLHMVGAGIAEVEVRALPGPPQSGDHPLGGRVQEAAPGRTPARSEVRDSRPEVHE